MIGVGKIKIAHGARSVEALLLRDLGQLLGSGCREGIPPLSHPVRIIVPSRSLRQHLAGLFVRHFGRPVAGVLVQTLRGAAGEIMERAGQGSHWGNWVLELLVRRFAREEPSLREVLDGLMDGYGTAVGTVLDFLDAGLEEVHGEALDEALLDLQPPVAPRATVERWRALVRVACRAQEALKSHKVGWISSAFKWAATLLQQDPRRLPARAVLVHGFSDATGVATDLIEAMLRHCGAWIYWDRPHDPARPGQDDLGVQFTLRFFERLRSAATVEEDPQPLAPHPEVRVVRAAGVNAEIRDVALRIVSLWEQGIRPEGIGLVARDLSGYRIPIRFHFHRLGIPFSGLGTLGPPDGVGRKIRALLEFLKRKADCTVDQWLDVLEVEGGLDLRLCFRSLGVARLHEVGPVNLEAVLTDSGDYPLPVRRGLTGEEEGAQEATVMAPRRRVPGKALTEAIELARDAIRTWATWPGSGSFLFHQEALLRLLREGLLWSQGLPFETQVLEALEALGQEIPGHISLSYDEFVLLLTHALRDAGAPAVGGAGGGVQVLDVMEARGRTFDHLFIVGLNKDVFPRLVKEDPLLPDTIRRALAVVLPDLPIKALGHDEERYLFAQLVSSSPRITLSWQSVDENGKSLSPSPFLERLRLARAWAEPEVAPPVYAAPTHGTGSERDEVRPAQEHAIMVGLYGTRQHFGRILPLALAETHFQEGDTCLRALSEAKVAILQELDPDRRTPEGRERSVVLGPYFGFVGPIRLPADPRNSAPSVSVLEQMASCPWRIFLGRLLRIEPVPDPLEALPGVDELLLGLVIHRALERMARGVLPEMPTVVDAAVRSDGVSADWPGEAEVERILAVEARRAIREAGIGVTGLARVLVAQARPYLRVAQGLDWSSGADDVRLLAAEVQGAVNVEDSHVSHRMVRFTADRLDRSQGRFRLTDYKTGKPISEAMKGGTRYRDFVREVRAGLRLQAVAYVLGMVGAEAEGRYVFLRPGIRDDSREFRVTRADHDLVRAFGDAVRILMLAMDQGVFFPRLVDTDKKEEPRTCAYCEVAQACLRGDTGARSRLLTWLDGVRKSMTDGMGLGRDEKAMLQLWDMAADSSEEEG